MRLINVDTLALESFFGKSPPPYAILSHTWEDGEVLFEEFDHPEAKLKPGYQKILSSCAQAKTDGHQFIWVDTCCIDKRSSAELSEAINSMFTWYQEAVVCYAFLNDVYSLDTMGEAKWFTRGWTLQELIAPVEVRLFAADWNFLGTRDHLSRRISVITRIDEQALVSAQGVLFARSTSVAKRMSWAATRTTTRVEDIAYCLLGLFNVHMALLYGERHAAFRRLQEEIIRTSTDQSLFAWQSGRHAPGIPIGLLAESPADFRKSGNILVSHDDETSFQLSNRDLSIKLPYAPVTAGSRTRVVAYLSCYREDQPMSRVTLHLAAVKPMDGAAIRAFYQFLGISLLQPDPAFSEFVRLSGTFRTEPTSLTNLPPRPSHLRILRIPQYQVPRSRVFTAHYRSDSLSNKSLHLKSIMATDCKFVPDPLHGFLLPSLEGGITCAALFQTSDLQNHLVIRVRTHPEPLYTAFIVSMEQYDNSEVQIAEKLLTDEWAANQQHSGSRTKQSRFWEAYLSWQTGFGHDILVLEVRRRPRSWYIMPGYVVTTSVISTFLEPYQVVLLAVSMIGTAEYLLESHEFSLRRILALALLCSLYSFTELLTLIWDDIPFLRNRIRLSRQYEDVGSTVPFWVSLLPYICLTWAPLFVRLVWSSLSNFFLQYISETPRNFDSLI